MSRRKTEGTVYLLHFDRPYRHARHYTGWTSDLDGRLSDHRAGRGARLLEVLRDNGIGWELARTWSGTRARERQLKREGGASRRCPKCGVHPREVTEAAETAVKARRDIAARHASNDRARAWQPGPPLPSWAREMPAAELDSKLAQVEAQWSDNKRDRRRTR